MSLATACLSVCEASGHPTIEYSVNEWLGCEAGEYTVHSDPCHCNNKLLEILPIDNFICDTFVK